MEPTNMYTKFLRSSIVVILILVLVVGWIVVKISKRVPSTEELPRAGSMAQQTASQLPGTMRLIKTRANGTIVMRAKADSKNAKITGFDVMIRYDHTLFRLSKVEGLLSGFDYYDTDDQVDPTTSELIVTAVRSIGNEDKNVLIDKDVLEVTFTRLNRADTEIFDLVFEPGTVRYSNMIDTDSRNILGKAQDLDLKKSL